MAANRYTIANKNPGDVWTSAEHNLLKAVHNLVAEQVCDNEAAITTVNTRVDDLNIAELNDQPQW